MAFATQCPHCRTIFRVAYDQLKIHAGLVRCGTCQEVFNGVEHLVLPNELKSPQTEIKTPSSTLSPNIPLAQTTTHPDKKPAPPVVPTKTPVQINSAAQKTPSLSIKDRAKSSISYKEEPHFVARTREQQRIRHALRIFMIVASYVLVFTAVGQGLYVLRNDLAAWFPAIRPALNNACTLLNCRIELPQKIDQISIESSELQTLPDQKNIVTFNALIQNQSSTTQAWPYLELTLTNENERAIARRVFTPKEYVPAPEQNTQGFAPHSEHPIKLFFDLSQLKASGYRAYLFYP